MQATAAGNWPVNGPFYIEDVFSTWLYTGTGATRTITNGIDLAGRGGLVWTKGRSAITDNLWFDTVRGVQKELSSNKTNAEATNTLGITAFGATGYSMGSDGSLNGSGTTYASWTFERFSRFFDIVTYTGNGTSQNIAHNLGSVPGCIIVKQTNATRGWYVYHRSLGADKEMLLNQTTAAATDLSTWNNTSPTSTQFSVGATSSTNASGGTYVAYLFAHNAGGFGLTGTDNVISCGSYTGNSVSGGQFISLGYEPQWVLQKNSTGTANDWHIQDVMRGAPVPSTSGKVLRPNSNIAEYDGTNAYPAATGFFATGDDNNSGTTYIYIAIRRGPMKVPTTGTSVLGLNARTGTGSNTTVTGGSSVSDLTIIKNRGTEVFPSPTWASRLTGNYYMGSSSDVVESESGAIFPTNSWDVMNGVKVGTSQFLNASSNTYINYLFSRSPGFFDEVCYTGNSTSGTYYNHNLNAVPEMMIFKSRNVALDWTVYHQALGSARLTLNNTDQALGTIFLFSPTSTQIQLGGSPLVNGSTYNYVAYLFASCPGVSKVGSFTGTGATQVINCGFTAGARFVLIKSTSASGAWYVWDSARGIVAGNDPYLRLNSTAAEVTNTDWVDTAATGFELSNAVGNLANTNGVSYIFLAIA
jgi:hypothetical protein